MVGTTSARDSLAQEPYSASWQALRNSAKQFSKILILRFIDADKNSYSDPEELYKIGKLVLKSIEFRRNLLDRRRGPKWTEEKQLRRMELQVQRVMSRLEKKLANHQRRF